MVIRRLGKEDWPRAVARVLQARVDACTSVYGHCNIMLTGGRSAGKVYTAWSKLPEFKGVRDVLYLFGDERCVAPDSKESNFRLVCDTLFADGVPEACVVRRIEAEHDDAMAAAEMYERQLPARIDVLLLSLGDDGHIASLFPGEPALHEKVRLFLPTTSPVAPTGRISITPPTLGRANEIYVMAIGPVKEAMLAEALRASDDTDAIPARLVLTRTWLLC